jgi:hypothetical protein
MLIATLFSGCTNLGVQVQSSLEAYAPEIIVSTNHRTFTEDNQPSTFKISSDTLYAITKWSNLEGKLINYLCKMYDGDGKLAFSMGGRILPDRPVYYYQSNYGPHHAIDKQGMWRIEVYVDNILVATRELKAVE